MFDVEYYEKEDGTFPAEEFILSLDSKMQAKMFRELDLLETFGNQLREPHSKPLGDVIYEIRERWLPTLQEFCISSWSIRR